MTTHSKLSPSGSKRWMKCSGSINLCNSLKKKDKSSIYADEGSVAHSIGEKCLLDEFYDPADFLGSVISYNRRAFTVSQEMVDAVTVYVNYVRKRLVELEAAKAILKVEYYGSLEILGVPGLDGGTTDALIYSVVKRKIIVIDYKHGSGVWVDAEDNPQLLQYALGCLLELDPQRVHNWDIEIVVVQPRCKSKGSQVIRSMELTSDELWDWCDTELVPKAKATQDPNAPLVPDDEGCRFCIAGDTGNCPALNDLLMDSAIMDFYDQPEDVKKGLSSEQKMFILQHGDKIKKFIDGVEKGIKEDILDGSRDYRHMFKLVRRDTKRTLKSDGIEVLEFYLDKDDMYDRKPKGIGKLEKALKAHYTAAEIKEIMSEAFYKPEGAIMVAPAGDPRPEVEISAIADFTDYEGEHNG